MVLTAKCDQYTYRSDLIVDDVVLIRCLYFTESLPSFPFIGSRIRTYTIFIYIPNELVSPKLSEV